MQLAFKVQTLRLMLRESMSLQYVASLGCGCVRRPQEMEGKGKVLPQQANVAQGVPSRLRPRIFLTFGTTRVVCRQPYAPAAFTPGEIPATHFQRLIRLPGHMVLSVATEKIPSDNTGNRSRDLPTSSAVP
jgi:hypothetical protein